MIMAWYNESIFYHIYPLGLSGAPLTNDYSTITHRLNDLLPWIDHIKRINCNAIYIGPLFMSSGHGYETTDYMNLDNRLGTNEDLKNFVDKCHKENIKVIFDGVFNHTGRDFFAFKDIINNKQSSKYKDWYLNVDFNSNNEFNDGFSYANWGGYNIMAKLNQRNPEVQNYICDVVRYWVKEFDVDGLRLDAADVLDFEFMKVLRRLADEVKPDFWLMGEVIHGDYSRWENNNTLHSVTNYTLHKGLYNGHNEHNYFEIAHTIDYVSRLLDPKTLYTFVDNHDVARIYSKLNNKAHMFPVYVLLYTLPGIPSIYYGSEFGIEGDKEKYSDNSIRPSLNLNDYKDSYTTNVYTKLIIKLGELRKKLPHLAYGDYKKLYLTNRQYAFSRIYNNNEIVIITNNDDNDVTIDLALSSNNLKYGGVFTSKVYTQNGNSLSITLKPNSAEVLIPSNLDTKVISKSIEMPKVKVEEKVVEKVKEVKTPSIDINKNIDDMTIEELQYSILEKMAKNGPVTDQMRKTVTDNIWHDSLVSWLKSFH